MTGCIICGNSAVSDYYVDSKHHFLTCHNCTTIFRNPFTYLDAASEKNRYLAHNNDVNNLGFQKFVAPIVYAVTDSFSTNRVGLDFGAGTGPVIAKLLSEKGYTVHLYDPFFHPDTAVLDAQYDFIICCEVIEHFYNPPKEFKRLYALLNPQGKLFCMTHVWEDKTLIEFKQWYYKNDPTHVVFYNNENLKCIQKTAGFVSLAIEDRLLTFTKN